LVSDLEKNLLHVVDPERPFFEPRAEREQRVTALISKRFGKRYLLRTRDDADLVQLLGQEFSISVLLPDSEGNYSQKSYNTIISGIYEGQDVTESENRIYIDLHQAREISGLDIGYQEVRVKLADYDEAHSVRETIKAQLDGFSIDTWEEIRRDFLQAVDSEKVLLVIVLSFIIMLGGFIILATLTLTVVEKTRDIGILAALGAPQSGILSIFVWTGLWIGILGSGLGVLAGAWFVDNVEGVRQGIQSVTGVDVFPAHIYRFRSIPAIWDWPSVIWIASGAVIMSFIAGLVPALRAARMDPVKALRHD
jgi:lipoprotein-releasing system permease protein